MPNVEGQPDSPDRPLLDLIRRRGPLTVAEMAAALGVTPTAIRNRLTRLVGPGLGERRGGLGGPARAARHDPARPRDRGRGRPRRRRRAIGPEAAFLPLLRAGRDGPVGLRHGTEDV